MSYIFHIATRSDWETAAATGDYRVSTLGKTLDEVGFIHCSTAKQVQQVADRYYRGLADLLLLTIETDRVTSPVRYDSVGDETYPHIYGPINLDAVAQVTPIASGPNGRIVVSDLPGVKDIWDSGSLSGATSDDDSRGAKTTREQKD